MKKYLLAFLLVPAIGFAQVKKTPVKKTNTPKPKMATKPSLPELKPVDGFLIKGTITGYPDGVNVDLLNAQSGMPEASSKLTNGKFSLTGKMSTPDFKLITVNSQPVYIPLFLDNSLVTVTAQKDAFDKAIVKGSATHDDFVRFSAVIKPYEGLLVQNAAPNPPLSKEGGEALSKFIAANPGSYVTPLAIFRYQQLTADVDKMEPMFNGLSNEIKASPIGNFLAQQITELKKNPIGKPLAEFSQQDTSGNPVALSSFKGKYVLVDFWASWCGPCRQENPNLVNMYNRYKDKNFTVFGISLDKSKQPWIDAIHADGLSWTHVSDLKGWANDVAHQFEITSIPQNFLVDPQGNVIAKNLRGPALEAKLATLLK